MMKPRRTCFTPVGFYPSFVPVLNSMSVTTAPAGAFTQVDVYGANFLPDRVTYVQFGTASLPVTYFSSFNVSFIVPMDLSAGTYDVQVVNIYSNQFAPKVKPSYPSNLNGSTQVVSFVLT